MPTTEYIHKVVYAFPNTEECKQFLQRLCVATFGNYTQQQRLQIMSGALAFPPGDPNSVMGYFTNVEGSSVATHLGASAQMKQVHWGFFQSQLVQALVDFDGVLFTRFRLNVDDEYAIAESNVEAVDDLRNEVIDEYIVTMMMGLYDVTSSPMSPVFGAGASGTTGSPGTPGKGKK
jgi:hypothetical protein